MPRTTRPRPSVRGFLDAHPHVTCVVTDDAWWVDKRPEQLNTRQRINANVVKALLSRVDWADWVFHIDADEVVQIDRSVLGRVPAATRAVKLAPLEAVSRRQWDGDPTWFKRLLDADDLTLLHTLGAVDRPSNGAYFHGHVDGKSGIRPTTDLWLALHHVVDAEKNEVESFTDPGLRLLHYESFSGEDFVRKWTSILAAGPVPNFRPGREPTAVALRTLIGKGLSAEQAAPYLMRIFERTTEDDFDTLRDLGLLEHVDPRAGEHVPAPLPDGAESDLLAALESLAAEPKRPFHTGQPPAKVGEAPRPAAVTRPNCPTALPGHGRDRPAGRDLDEQARPSGLTRDRQQASEAALVSVVPGQVEAGSRDRSLGVAHHAEQATAALAVGAGPGLRLPRRAVVRRVAGRAPRAPVRDRAGAATRPGGRADQRAELHQGDRPGGRVGVRLRQQVGGEAAFGCAGGDGR